jgi:large repetitive protein
VIERIVREGYMAKVKKRWVGLRAAGVISVASTLALAGLALVAAPANAAITTTTTVTGPTVAQARTGAPVTFTAAVTHGSQSAMTGTVTFTITDVNSNTYTCDGGNTVSVATAVPGPGVNAQCSFSGGLLAADSPYTVNAVYSGDSNYSTSTGTLSQTIKRGVTSTSVTPASSPVVTGQPVTFTAAVSPVSPSTGVPTGQVVFTITGNATTVVCDAGDTQTLDGSGMAQCSVAAGLLAADSPYTVSAVYSGDSNYQPSTGTGTEVVDKAGATLSVTSAPSSLVMGQPVAFTATVTGINPPGSGTPTGSIVFSVVGGNGMTATCQNGDTQMLSGSSAVCNFPNGLPAGALTYTITANLQDPNFNSPVAGTLVQPVSRAHTMTTVTGLPGSVVASQPFFFTITIKTTAPGTGAPTGDYEWAVCPNNPDDVCTPANRTRGGTFVLPTPTTYDIKHNLNKAHVELVGGLFPGFYDVSAEYVGNKQLTASPSNVGHVLVSTIPTTLSFNFTHNPIPQGERLQIRVGVLADSRATDALGAPSGTVTYTITGQASDTLSCNGGSNVITISTTAKNQGIAKCVIPKGVLMSTDAPYKVTAVYSGDTNYTGETHSMSLRVVAP